MLRCLTSLHMVKVFALSSVLVFVGCAPLIVAGGLGGLYAAKEMKGKNKSFGEFIDDSVLTAKINSVINSRNLSFRKIDFHVDRGVVVISGTAPSEEDVREIVAAIQGMIEVKSVHSELTVDATGNAQSASQ